MIVYKRREEKQERYELFIYEEHGMDMRQRQEEKEKRCIIRLNPKWMTDTMDFRSHFSPSIFM